jgi:hypothetical protein
VDGAGDLFIADNGASSVFELPAGCTTSACQITVTSELSGPSSVSVDAAGDVFVADTYNNRVVEVPTLGNGNYGPEIIVGSGLASPGGVALDAAGDVFIADTQHSRVVVVQRSEPPAFSFAPTPIGAISSDSPQSAMLQNIGNQPLNAISPGLSVGANFVQVAGSGTIADCSSGFSLTPGSSCNLSVSFAPQTVGPINTAAVFTDNALNVNSPAPATQSIALQGTGIQAGPQTITVTVPAPPIEGNLNSFTVAATASSGLPVSYGSSGVCYNVGPTYIMGAKAGTCTVTFNQPGNASYLPAPTITETTIVDKAIAQTVTFTGAPRSATYLSTFAVATSSSAGITPTITASGPCTISGNTVTITIGIGTCSLNAYWPASGIYKAASAKQTTTAKKATPVLTWATPSPITYGTKLSSTQLNATANVAGTFKYAPAAGSKPKVPVPPATCDTLKVTFTPTLNEDYASETATVCLVVNP